MMSILQTATAQNDYKHDSDDDDPPVWGAIKRERYGFLAGRNELPEILWDAYEANRLSKDDLAFAICDSWVGCEYPAYSLDDFKWLEMFYEVGFIRNGKRGRRPPLRRTKRLYRGASVHHELGMSWTEDETLARWFYERSLGFGFASSLIVADIPGYALFAFIDSVRDGESEWVVDHEQIWDYDVIETKSPKPKLNARKPIAATDN